MKPLARIPFRPAGVLVALALLATALMSGCGRSKSVSLLAPTGVRPVAANPTGGLWGYLIFDPTHYPGLDLPPYPPTQIDVYNAAGKHVDSLVTSRTSRHFEFTHLPPGHYSLTLRSHAFGLGSFGPYVVTDFAQDTGDLALQYNQDSLTSTVFVTGTMPGFSADELMNGTYSTLMSAPIVEGSANGLWIYPSDFGATPVPAGTYRFKFVTDQSSTSNHLIGWGGDSTQVLTAPITEAPLRFGTGPVSDLKVTFPAAGTYVFSFDERRLTFSLALATAPARAARAVSRRIR